MNEKKILLLLGEEEMSEIALKIATKSWITWALTFESDSNMFALRIDIAVGWHTKWIIVELKKVE